MAMLLRSRFATRFAHGTRARFHVSTCTSQQLGCYTDEDTSWDWMKDPENPRMKQFLQLERNYLANQVSKPKFRKVERALNVELRNRLLRENFSIPECIVYYRRLRGSEAHEMVLNQNVEKIALNHEFQFVAGMKISPDAAQMLLVMENESEKCCVVLKDLRTGKLQPLGDVRDVKNVEWGASVLRKTVFYYTKVDCNGRPFAVYRYNLTTHKQEKLYEEQDEAFFVDVSLTKDGAYVLINCNSKNTSEIYALDSQNAQAQPQLLRLRDSGTLYFADHAVGQFFIVTNADGALNYKIATFKWLHSSMNQWETLVPEHKDVKIEDLDLFQKYLVLYERVNSIPRIRVYPLGTNSSPAYFIPLPKEHEICRISPGVNRDYDAHCVRFQVSTPLVPEIVFNYDMKTKKLHKLKETELTDRSMKQKHKNGSKKTAISSFEPEKYVSQRCFVPSMSSLGVEIPLTLIHRRDLTLNGQNPTLLIGYGAYGTNLEADFELEHLSLLERGWVIALAHSRGGGELGLQWYKAGYTSPPKLAGKGVSAGGLVMGYVANEYPQLYQALVMKVPFVDILATMKDPNLPLTVHEYDEWGDPNDPKTHNYIHSYAPCENVRKTQKYPAMFVTGSLNDTRVQFWEPAKWVYQLRKTQTLLSKDEKRLMLLKMSQEDGHFGGGGRFEQLEESAMEIAFLYQALNLPFAH